MKNEEAKEATVPAKGDLVVVLEGPGRDIQEKFHGVFRHTESPNRAVPDCEAKKLLMVFTEESMRVRKQLAPRKQRQGRRLPLLGGGRGKRSVLLL